MALCSDAVDGQLPISLSTQPNQFQNMSFANTFKNAGRFLDSMMKNLVDRGEVFS